MSGLFAPKTKVAKTAPEVTSLRVTTSCYGRVIPVGWGQFRIAGWLMDYDNFRAIAHTSRQDAGGKGGGRRGATTTTYTYEAGALIGLCEGPINGVHKLWKGKDYLTGVGTTTTTYTKEEGQVVGSSGPLQFTVNAPGTVLSTISVRGYATSTDWDNPPAVFVEGVDYTRSGNVYTFASAAYDGLPVQVAYTWSRTNDPVSPLGQANLTLFKGDYSQNAFSFWSTNYASKALNYRGIAYLATSAYQLGDQPDMPNTAAEIDSTFGYSSTIRDVDPRDFLVDFLINPYYGAFYTQQQLADWRSYSDYCIASGLFLSPEYTEQSPASEILERVAAITNSDFAIIDKKLHLIPYADQAVSGNGKSWTPNLTAVYELTDDDFLPNGAGGPIKIRRKAPNARYNQLRVKFRNRANQYNDDVYEAKDEAEIGRNGLRPAPYEEDVPEIKDSAVAARVGALLVQRCVNICNTYSFVLKANKAMLTPMDLVTLTHSRQQLTSVLVRIVKIVEEGNALNVEAEEVPIGTASAVLYPSQAPGGLTVNYNQKPLSVSTPFFFEAPMEEAGETGLAVNVAVTGQAGDALWAGCGVWLSYDSGANYRRVGQILGGARYGTLNASLATGAAATLAVTLQGLGGQLNSGSAVDAANRATLCYVENAAYGEYLSYQNAALVVANQYNLTTLSRGQFNTQDQAASIGAKFARVDQAVFRGAALPIDQINRTLYFKFTSFNVYQAGEQDLADATEYTYTIRGNMLRVAQYYSDQIRLLPNSSATDAIVAVGARATKVFGGSAWDASVHTANSITGPCIASATAESAVHDIMFGLNADPTTDASYTSLDHAVFLRSDNTYEFYENGSSASGVLGSYVRGDKFDVVYNGYAIEYRKNGATVFTRGTAPGRTFFFDSSFFHVGAVLSRIAFYPVTPSPRGSLIDSSSWIVGTTDSQGNVGGNRFVSIGNAGENFIELHIAPDGVRRPCWRCLSTDVVGSSGDGGFDTGKVPIDITKAYRFHVWIKPTVIASLDTNAGRLYLGPSVDDVAEITSGAADSNPYFVLPYRSNLVQGRWYLAIGIVLPFGSGTTQYNMGGVYDVATGQKILNGTDFKWLSNRHSVGLRAYQYYADTTNEQIFFDPQIELMDGTERSVDELLALARGQLTSVPLDFATSINLNGQFTNWLYGAPYPDGWSDWANGATTITKETTITRTGPNAVRGFGDGTNTRGILNSYTFTTPPPLGSHLRGSFDVYLASYTSGGTPGYLFRLYTNVGLTTYRDTLVQAPSTATGGWQRVPFVASVNDGESIYGITIYQMSSWISFVGGHFNGQVVFDSLEIDLVSPTNTLQLVGGAATPSVQSTYPADNTYSWSSGSGLIPPQSQIGILSYTNNTGRVVNVEMSSAGNGYGSGGGGTANGRPTVQAYWDKTVAGTVSNKVTYLTATEAAVGGVLHTTLNPGDTINFRLYALLKTTASGTWSAGSITWSEVAMRMTVIGA